MTDLLLHQKVDEILKYVKPKEKMNITYVVQLVMDLEYNYKTLQEYEKLTEQAKRQHFLSFELKVSNLLTRLGEMRRRLQIMKKEGSI